MGSDLLVRHQKTLNHSGLVIDDSVPSSNEITGATVEQLLHAPFQDQEARSLLDPATTNPGATDSSATDSPKDIIRRHNPEAAQYSLTGQSVPSSFVNPPFDDSFLWSDVYDFLPTTLFDTDQTLADLWTSDLLGEDGTLNMSTFTDAPLQPSLSAPEIITPDELDTAAFEMETPNTEKLPASDLGSHKAFDVQLPSPPMSPWSVSEHAYERLSKAIRSCGRGVIPSDFSLPSKHTISRYLRAYFEGFHKHFPFLHEASTTVDNLALELLLGLCAVGAFHCFEHRKGWQLYRASKACVMHNLEKFSPMPASSVPTTSTERECFGLNMDLQTSRTRRSNSASARSGGIAGEEHPNVHLQTIQAFVVLIAMASWVDVAHTKEALSMSSHLAMLVRAAGVSDPDEIREGTPWLDWIRLEERRRTLFVAYILFNLHSIAFNVAPLLLNQEVSLFLPHCGSEWRAETAAHFNHLRRSYGHNERSFREALGDLLCGREIHTEGPLSAFGNYVLMHGLVQQIFLERQSSAWYIRQSPVLRNDATKAFESALRAWQLSWEATQESTLDPASPKGPLGFDAAALLRLGYIRVNADMGPNRALLSCDPQRIADAVMDDGVSVFVCSSHVDRAVLQSIHALSIPLRTGISVVAYTQNIPWSVQSVLCSLECAVLLSRWLCNLATFIESPGVRSITQDEAKLLRMVKNLMRESNICQFAAYNEIHVPDIRSMAVSVVRAWAGTFKGVNVCNTVDVIRLALLTAADDLEARLETPSN